MVKSGMLKRLAMATGIGLMTLAMSTSPALPEKDTLLHEFQSYRNHYLRFREIPLEYRSPEWHEIPLEHKSQFEKYLPFCA